jgi:hypothetical protein
MPLGTEASFNRETIFAAFGNSTRDVVPVASTTERTSLVSNLTAKGQGPASTRPLVVYRHDAPGLHRLEWTIDGTVWMPGSGVLRFATVSARDSWTTTNSGYLSPNDICEVGDVEYKWVGAAWLRWPASEATAITTYGTSVTADTNIPPVVWTVGDQVHISGLVSVDVGYTEANLLTVPTGFRLVGSRNATMIGSVVTSGGKSCQLYMLKSDNRIRILYRDAAPGAGEQIPIVGFWRRDL